MPDYAFVARDAQGRVRTGTRDAASEALLLMHLRADGLFAVDVRDAGPTGKEEEGEAPRGWLSRHLPPRPIDVELGLRQLATMQKSGMTLLASLQLVAAQSERDAMERVWQQVTARIHVGEPLSTALAAQRVFPPIVVTLARLGEKTGELDRVLQRAAAALERRRMLKLSVVTALTYPAIVVVMATATVTYMLVALLPKLTEFLTSFGRRLPAVTQFVVDLSTFMRVHVVEGVVLVGVLVVTFVMIRSTTRGRLMIDRNALRAPLVGPILHLSATASFTRNLGLMLASGVRLTEALEVVETMISNRWISQRVKVVRERVLAGGGFAKPLTASGAFPRMVGRMAVVGEASGTLDNVLLDVADYHDERLAARIRRLAAILEPLIVIVLGLIVGFVYLAFFLAIYAIAGSRS